MAGQHVRLRVFFSGRIFESHPLTILNAPAPLSSMCTRELILAARVSGDWTRALNESARREEKTCRVNVMIDGPYGGPTIDIGEYESVLLVAGGSGATFAIGLLDDIVGRVVNMKRQGGERTARVEFVWCIKSFGMFSSCSVGVVFMSSFLRFHILVFSNVARHCQQSTRFIFGAIH